MLQRDIRTQLESFIEINLKKKKGWKKNQAKRENIIGNLTKKNAKRKRKIQRNETENRTDKIHVKGK